MIVLINIGSNIGDRRAHIELAVARIEAAFGCEARRAPVVESEPWGFDSAGNFLNLGIALDLSGYEPMAILEKLKSVERSIDASPHRDATGAYIDRVIDIDLIAVDHVRIDIPGLTLPHPRMWQRRFVMEPIEYLAPWWIEEEKRFVDKN